MLADGRLYALDRVEVAVLAQQRGAERSSEAVGIAAGAEERRDERAGLLDLLLPVEEHGQVGEQRGRVDVRLWLWQPSCGDVEEAVEVDAHRRVEHSAHELW